MFTYINEYMYICVYVYTYQCTNFGVESPIFKPKDMLFQLKWGTLKEGYV